MYRGDVIRAEHLLRRVQFGQHVHDGPFHRDVGAKMGFEESDGHVDATVGNAVVVAGRCCQPLQPTFFRLGRAHAVHRHGGGIVDPDDILAQRVAAPPRHESPGGCRAFIGPYLLHGPCAYPRRRMIAAGGAQQYGGRAAQACIGSKCVEPCVLLVDDEEAGARVVACVRDPVRDMADFVRCCIDAEISESRARRNGNEPCHRFACVLRAGRKWKEKRQRRYTDQDATPDRGRYIRIRIHRSGCAGWFHDKWINGVVRARLLQSSCQLRSARATSSPEVLSPAPVGFSLDMSRSALARSRSLVVSLAVSGVLPV